MVGDQFSTPSNFYLFVLLISLVTVADAPSARVSEAPTLTLGAAHPPMSFPLRIKQWDESCCQATNIQPKVGNTFLILVQVVIIKV
jgi:hypothetical protein